MAVSPIYAAPEVIRGECGHDEEQIDVCAHDVWSLGCLAFEMLTDRSLFVGDAQIPKLAVMELHSSWVSISYQHKLCRTTMLWKFCEHSITQHACPCLCWYLKPAGRMACDQLAECCAACCGHCDAIQDGKS